MQTEKSSCTQHSIQAVDYVITGRVQGVGFRPFVYRLAMEHAITGWVENQLGQVLIHAEGYTQNLQAFAEDLVREAPTHSEPFIAESCSSGNAQHEEFTIRQSRIDTAIQVHVVSDLPVCDDCLEEMTDVNNRRYQYPFINCTNCGPRYTLIRSLPYDRANTTMAGFSLCDACEEEYNAPANRRFHAEPIACPSCGPQLVFRANDNVNHENGDALLACTRAIHEGDIVAVKGVGGYHLVCDACNDKAVNLLRQRKHRPGKPLAVMMTDAMLEEHVDATAIERSMLAGNIHPVMLVVKKHPGTLSTHIAPGLLEIGVMLPYSPLHHLLLQQFNGPLVVTSANISGEPVITDNEIIERRLANVADACLHHNRPIQRPADDPVYRLIYNKPRPFRTGRGNAPLELGMPFKLRNPVIAVGGHMKNTVALAWEDRIVISPHIGDLGSLRSQEVFEQTIDDLQALYHVRAQHIVCDAHTGYSSSHWAKKHGLPVQEVYHHHAHAALLAGEFPQVEKWLVFTWDGAGLGPGEELWGGEAMLGRPGDWQRVASLRPFNLPGGERASREPWRSAAALCWETGTGWQPAVDNYEALHMAWKSKLNCPRTSSAGRLFDAAAALTGLNLVSSFEGQGPMLLEAVAASGEGDAVDLPLLKDAQGTWRTDWSPLLPILADSNVKAADRARIFHESMANAILQQALQVNSTSTEFSVGLCGGVFQNRLLSERVMDLLQQHGFPCYLPEHLPVNDAGLCYGQVVEFHAVKVNKTGK